MNCLIHFGLTSQDINNTGIPRSIKDAISVAYMPALEQMLYQLQDLAVEWEQIPVLARTHGQAATPTLFGKEMMVFVKRLQGQLESLEKVPFRAKFGGAIGNMNAHFVTYPDINWHDFADTFIKNMGLERSYPTTQIEAYDFLSSLLHNMERINTILIDFCRDIWTYISMDYLKQKVIKNEVGSSAMPHKVNPIDFENAEGNLGIANALFQHLAQKLPVSRLQRDLTDSTVLRNIGVPRAHTLIAFQSLKKGIGKLLLNEKALYDDLEKNWVVVAEAIQNILRRESYPNPYEALKSLTRGKTDIRRKDIHRFIKSLDVSNSVKEELLKISPHNYVGKNASIQG